MRPKNFDNQDKENHVAGLERNFENLCVSLEDLGVPNPRKLTTFEFYSRIVYYKKKHKPKQQHHG